MTRTLTAACAATSLVLTAGSFFLAGRGWFGLLLLVLGGGWVFGLRRKVAWVTTFGLFIVYVFSAFGIWNRQAVLLLLPGSLFTLLAWDLDDFSGRLALAGPEDNVRALERRHFRWLGGTALAGLVLCLTPLFVPLRFNFEWVIVMIVLGVWGVGRVINLLLKKR